MAVVIVIELLLRGVALGGGLVACYGALFLYENEERLVQNVLEGWWIRIADLRRDLMSRHAAFVLGTASLTRTLLDRVFGLRLFSVRSFAVSVCLSYSSLALLMMSVQAELIRDIESGGASKYGLDPTLPPSTYFEFFRVLGLLGVLSLLSIAAGTLTMFRWLPAASAIGIFAFLAFDRQGSLAAGFRDLARMFIILVVAMGWSVAAIAALRAMITWQSQRRSSIATYLVGLGALLLAPSFTFAPAFVGWTLYYHDHRHIGTVILMSSVMNVGICAIVFVFGCSAIALLVHRMAWPVIDRPLYRLARIGVLKTASTRAALFVAGAAAVVVALGLGDDVGGIIRFLFLAA